MPIVLKNYSWNQTEKLVVIQVPLKGVCLKNIDVFTSDKYLKIHSPPHLFETFLWRPIIEAESSCTITNGEAIFSLVKEAAETWPSVAADISRQEALKIKQKAIEEAQTKAEIRRKEIAAIKDARQKEAVKEQIRLNTEEREIIEKTREQERASALAQMGWAKNSSKVQITELSEEKQENHLINKKEDKNIFKERNRPESRNNTNLPAPRQSAQIAVTFTPRVFPTPCRESKITEEQEWLSKQAEARRRTGFVPEDLRPEEQDPLWLCDKAQSFYNVSNYLGAVSAYTHALTLNSHMYELYAGRADAQLKLGNFNRAVVDSSKVNLVKRQPIDILHMLLEDMFSHPPRWTRLAVTYSVCMCERCIQSAPGALYLFHNKALELLSPPVAANAAARAQCLLCRGLALSALGLHTEAVGELRAALRLTPGCSQIQDVLAKLEAEGDAKEKS